MKDLNHDTKGSADNKSALMLNAFSLYREKKYKEALTALEMLLHVSAGSPRVLEFYKARCIERIDLNESASYSLETDARPYTRHVHDIDIIKSQGLFDADFYRRTYPDTRMMNDDDCILHYCMHGHAEGRRPIEGFLPFYYKKQADSAGLHVNGNPLVHFANQERSTRDSSIAGAFLYHEWVSSNIRSVHFPVTISPEINPREELTKRRIGVFCHIHYPDTAADTISSLMPLWGIADFHFTFTSEEALAKASTELMRLSSSRNKKLSLQVNDNKGRDLLPFAGSFNAHEADYDYVLKVHGKKSLDSDIVSGSEWRDYLFNNLVGCAGNVLSIIKIFEGDPGIGVVYPPHYKNVFQYCTWSDSFGGQDIDRLAKTLGFKYVESEIIDFPSGTMFWARSSSIKHWSDLVRSCQIEPEPLPRDGTVLHFLERAVKRVINQAGYEAYHHLNLSATSALIIRKSPLVSLADIVSWKICFVKKIATETISGKRRLAASWHDYPEYSIIIPAYKDHAMTLECICSVMLTMAEAAFEVIVVDDCSPEMLHLTLSRLGVNVIRSEANQGFVASCNAGAARARGKKLIFLNNDTIVMDGWIRYINRHLDNPEVGIVGSMLLYPDGSLQEAGGCIWSDGNGLNYGRNDNPNDPKYNFTREVDYCSGASLAIRSKDFLSLGGFDHAFSPGYYEDTDLCFRARSRGLKVVVEPRSKVIHLEGKSSEGALGGGMKKHQEINRLTFVERWKDVLPKHSRPCQDRFFANRTKSKKALFVDSYIPTPDKDSGSNDSYLAMKLLSECGFEVSFVPTWEIGFNVGYLDILQEIGVRIYPQDFQYHCAEWIKSLPEEFDICLILRYDNFHRFHDIVRSANPNALVLFDTVDLHFVREERRAKITDDKACDNHIENIRKAEIHAIRLSDHAYVRSSYEMSLLVRDHCIPEEKLSLLPICRDVIPPATPFTERKGLVFLGGFKHAPNIDCAKYLLEDLFPRILERDPSIHLTIAGSHIELLMDHLSSVEYSNVVFRGYVEDLSSLFSSHRLSVAPLRFGAGTKGKVISSMCHGIPCVATAVACEGMISIVNDFHILIRDDPDEFANKCIEIHSSPEKWHTISKNALAYAEDHASLSTMKKALLHPIEILFEKRKKQ